MQGGSWADRVRSGGGEKVTGGTAPEHGLAELNQLRKENAEMRSIIESLRAEMAELRRVSTSQATLASASPCVGSPSPQPMEVPMVVEAGPSGNPAKRKAATSAENVQARAKSEIKETLNSICLEIHKLNERFSAVDQRLTVMDQKIDIQHARIQCVENQLQNAGLMVQSPNIRGAARIHPDFFPEGTPLSAPIPMSIPSSNSTVASVQNLTAGSGSTSNDQDGLAR